MFYLIDLIMKLRTGKEIGYEISRGADYILFSVNDWRALSKMEKRDIFVEVINLDANLL